MNADKNVERVHHWEWTWNNDVMRMVDDDRVIEGREGLRAVERQMIEVDPSRRMVITKVVASGDTVVVEVESFWKDDSVVAKGCVVLTFDEEGQVVSDHTYSADPIGAADERATAT
jgi:hypothetical protein